jgi:hypothetical protein
LIEFKEFNMEIQWKRGDYRTFYAQMKIRVGGKDTLDIQKGDEFQYDGTIVKYAGAEFPQPGLRGAVKEGWATLTPQGGVVTPVRPERSLAKAQSVSKEFHRVQRNAPEALSTHDHDEDIVLQVGDHGDREIARKQGKHLTRDNKRVAGFEADVQDGEVVAKVRSSTNLVADVTKTTGLANALEDISFEGGYGRADGIVGKRKGFTSEGVSVSTNIGKIDPTDIQTDESDEGRIVGKVRNSSVSSEGGIKVKDTSGPPGKVAQKSIIEVDSSGDSKLQIARSLYSSFPEDWNFFAKPEDKLQRIKELGENPNFLKALYEAEGKKMRKTLRLQYPKQLS